MKIIAITGLAGSGKTTTVNIIRRHDHNARLFSFARPLKNMLGAFYESLGLSPQEIYDRLQGDLKETPDPYLAGRTPRYALQTLGTEWGRMLISPSLWVDSLFASVRDTETVLIDDCRFPNEAAAIRARGGKIIKIERPGLTQGAHASEQMDFPVDLTIQNIGTVEELEAAVLSTTGR